MHHELLFAGFGGQGIMFAGQLIAYAAMDAGYHVTWIPSYGPEMRGGTAYCQVVISDKPIGSPLFKHPEIALIFNRPSYDKFAPQVAAGGLLVYNASLVQDVPHRADITVIPVPASTIASELGDLQLTNMVMVGAALAAREVLPHDAIRTALEAHIPVHRRDKLPGNFTALARGAEVVAAKA